MTNSEATTAAGTQPFSSFGKRGMEKVRALLNYLTEGAFFYPGDDQDLFYFLRANQAEFGKFFETYFGWQLYVDRQCARLIKERHYNENISPSARWLFHLRRRDECLLFALLLEFFELEGQQQGVTADDSRHLRFLLSDFVRFAVRRFSELLGPACPAESKIFESVKPLFDQLCRYRFLNLIERKRADASEQLPSGMEQHLLYEFLPGIRCYDGSQAARQIVVETYSKSPATEDEPADLEGLSDERLNES